MTPCHERDAIHGVPAGAAPATVLRWRDRRLDEAVDWLAEEVPVALEFNGVSHAVMLATPTELEDFGLGFALSEGIVDSPAELYDCEVERAAAGWTLHLRISARACAGLKERRRTLAGRTGCGLCGTERLDQVLRPLPHVGSTSPVTATAIAAAVTALRGRQPLNQVTGSVHAAAWCAPDGAIGLLREDVGRHNALDKLIGARARGGPSAPGGFVAVTSRASVEMIQKAAIAGASLLAAVSAPTRLAVDTAQAAGMTLVGLARGDDLVIYSHPERVVLGAFSRNAP